MGKKQQFKIEVVLTIDAKSEDEAISKAWDTLQYGYIETTCNPGPPKGLKAVMIDEGEVRI